MRKCFFRCRHFLQRPRLTGQQPHLLFSSRRGAMCSSVVGREQSQSRWFRRWTPDPQRSGLNRGLAGVKGSICDIQSWRRPAVVVELVVKKEMQDSPAGACSLAIRSGQGCTASTRHWAARLVGICKIGARRRVMPTLTTCTDSSSCCPWRERAKESTLGSTLFLPLL